MLTSQYLGGGQFSDGETETVASVVSDRGITTGGFHSNTAISTQYEDIPGFDTYIDFVDELNKNGADSIHQPSYKRAYHSLTDILKPVVEKVPIMNSVARTVHEKFVSESIRHEYTAYIDAESLTDELISWSEEHADEEFFLWAHYMDPHRPYGIHLDDPVFLDRTPDREQIKQLMPKAAERPGEVTESEWELMIDLYDSDIRYVSDHLDRLLNTFKKLDIWDSTRIIFSADHGEEFGEHGYSFHRNRGYDTLTHVPLLVNLPNETGQSHPGVRELLDVAPTIASFYDAPTESFTGKNLFNDDDRSVVSVGSIRDDDKSVAVRTNEYKYIYSWLDDNNKTEETYDLSIGENEEGTINNADIIADLRSRIPETIVEGDFSVERSANTEAAKRRLQDLGYLE
jgi:arylsulfatase A-like enzyme